MIIKYKCWDYNQKVWRKADPDNMISQFEPVGDDAMQIVAMPGYEFIIWTGFEDKDGEDIYPGDILNDRYIVKWDILNGGWTIFDTEQPDEPPLTFRQFRPTVRKITGSIYEDPEKLHNIS